MYASTLSSFAASNLLRIAGGHSHAIALPSGAELFCASGTLLLRTTSFNGLEGMPDLHIRLHTGQSWRAPSALLVHATALQAPVQLRYCAPPVVAPESVPVATTTWQQRLRTGLLSLWPRGLLR